MSINPPISKSLLADFLQIHPNTLSRYCKQHGLWKGKDYRKSVPHEEAQTIKTHYNNKDAYQQIKINKTKEKKSNMFYK